MKNGKLTNEEKEEIIKVLLDGIEEERFILTTRSKGAFLGENHELLALFMTIIPNLVESGIPKEVLETGIKIALQDCK